MIDMVRILSLLPRQCLGVVGDRVVRISRGYPNTLAVPLDPGLVDIANQKQGVSPEQRATMERGVTYGWHRLSASEIPEGPVYDYQVCIPLVALVSIRARSDEAAIEAAMDQLELPEGVEPDGHATILSREER